MASQHGHTRFRQLLKTKGDTLMNAILSKVELLIPHEDGRFESVRVQILDEINDFVRGIEQVAKDEFSIKDLKTQTYIIRQK